MYKFTTLYLLKCEIKYVVINYNTKLFIIYLVKWESSFFLFLFAQYSFIGFIFKLICQQSKVIVISTIIHGIHVLFINSNCVFTCSIYTQLCLVNVE